MNVHRRTRSIVAVLCASILTVTSPASYADHLKDFLTDLYGGGGIFLPPAEDIPQNIADAHVPHFTGEEQIQELNALSSGILSGTGVFALNSTITGFTFDLSTGAPVATDQSLGPLLAERATTIGEGRLSFALGYSSQKFDELDGTDLDDIQVTFLHQDCCSVVPPIPPPDGDLTGFERDTIRLNIDIDLKQEVYALFTSYGVTDNWDIGAVIPVVSVEARAFSVAEIVLDGPQSLFGGNPVHSFAGDPDLAISSTGGKETGLGDVILRTKYSFGSPGDAWDMAVLGQVTLPTGEEKKLLGTGETKYKAMFIASRKYGRITPHVNVAWEQASSGSQYENLSYAVGLDARLTDRITGGVDVLGRYNHNIDVIGDHVIDLAFSAKWNPWSTANAPLTAFVSVPLNDDGLRADVVWGLGVEFILN